MRKNCRPPLGFGGTPTGGVAFGNAVVQVIKSLVTSTSYLVRGTTSQSRLMGGPLGKSCGPNRALNTHPTIGLIFVNTLMQSWPVAVSEPRFARATYQLVFTPRVGMKTFVRSGIGS